MELSWLTHEDFKERVVEIWNKPIIGQNAVQRWNRKLGALRKYLRGWTARHKHGQKHNLQTLDTLAETRLLTDGEREQLANARDGLINL